MTDKMYVISCSKDLESLGMDRRRMHVEGLEETTLTLDWSKVRIVPVLANDKVSFQPGDANYVPIQPIEIPAYAIVFQSFYGVNGMGHLACVGSLEFRPYTEDRVADMAMFRAHIKASVLKGDILGQILIVPGKKA
ncbi:MAG: hypothetical protein ACTSYL_12765 [Candidatus Thorarchaeota archaeon]